MQVALQAAHVGRFKGAELTPEGLVVPVVRLHMSVQTGNETKFKKKEVKNNNNSKTQKGGYEIRG